jgi:hypothetical protein
MYWGKDIHGNCLFVVELEGDQTEQFRRSSTSVHGISVDLRLLDTTRSQGLVLTLEQQVDRDLFLGLCETLIASLRQVADSATALAVALRHIQRWKAFMAGRKSRLLSVEEIRGLFAELQFLRVLYGEHLEEKAAVEAWSGPDGVHQDFIFGNTAVEVKALSGRERSAVRISSEDQLESVCDNLFLGVFRLGEAPDSDHALSLNALVRQIESELTDASAMEELSKRLAAYGYIELREYDEPRLIVTGRHIYRVTDDFPRLVRSALPVGVLRVTYDVGLDKIALFECAIDRVWGH